MQTFLSESQKPSVWSRAVFRPRLLMMGLAGDSELEQGRGLRACISLALERRQIPQGFPGTCRQGSGCWQWWGGVSMFQGQFLSNDLKRVRLSVGARSGFARSRTKHNHSKGGRAQACPGSRALPQLSSPGQRADSCLDPPTCGQVLQSAPGASGLSREASRLGLRLGPRHALTPCVMPCILFFSVSSSIYCSACKLE